MNALKWFRTFLAEHRTRYIVALSLATITAVCFIINPIISGLIVDDVVMGGNYALLPTLLLIFIAMTIFRSAVRYTYILIFERASQGILFRMRDYVFRRLHEQDFSFYNKNRTGDLMSRQTGDMEAIRHFTAFTIYSVYENVLFFLIAIVMIFLVDYRLALCIFCVVPLTALTAMKQLKSIRPAFHKIREQFSNLTTAVQENIGGNRVVKAFVREEYEIEKFGKENDAYQAAEIAAAMIWRKYVPAFEFFLSLTTIVLYLAGSIMVIGGTLTLGELVMVNGYIWMINLPLRMSGWLANDYQRFVTSVEKIYSTIDVEPDIKELDGAYTIPRINGQIAFRNVSYTVENEEILKDVSFNVMPGQTVGIIGATGSGKTTLMNLLCRFYDPSDGDILIDRVNLKNYDLTSLRGNIGMAMQDVFLFSDTIEGNIAYSSPGCTFAEVKAAAEIANADGFIMKLPEQYDTIVGERGVGLSGGQKQRISLARALLKDPAIVILDDTTSAVDTETEAIIQESLKYLGNRTVFIVAHRISSIKDADMILVIEDGSMVESGTHEELMEKEGYYARVFKQQYGDFD
ncbi:MAG: ABC transporter ATP-binding protein/permease [Lachnospiraceae bacterium]|jgi:ATP-binding cassette subfamily B protein|nr:ABC transporter ATP-binding protein/permease [Lachnospiraceae bacterium]